MNGFMIDFAENVKINLVVESGVECAIEGIP